MDKNQLGQYGVWWRGDKQLLLAKMDFLKIEVELINNVVLVLHIQQSFSYTYRYIAFFSDCFLLKIITKYWV